MARARHRSRNGKSASGHFGSVSGIELNKCHECGASNPTEIGEKHPERCSLCGSEIRYLAREKQTVSVKDFVSIEDRLRRAKRPSTRIALQDLLIEGREGRSEISSRGGIGGFEKKGAYKHKRK